MNRAESKEKTIVDLQNRNLYLESVFCGNKNLDEKIFETPHVYIVVETKTNKVVGVFLRPEDANYASAISAYDSKVEIWETQAAASEPVPEKAISNGAKVRFRIDGKVRDGFIMSNDNDFSLGLSKLTYKISSKKLQGESQKDIVIFHSDIEEVLYD